MKLKKFVLCSLLTGALSVSFAGNAYMAEAVSAAAISTDSENQTTYSLDFDASKNYTEESKTVNGQVVKYRAYRNVIYAAHTAKVQESFLCSRSPYKVFYHADVAR